MNICRGCKKLCKRIFCTVKCQQDYNYTQYIARWKEGLETGIRGRNATSSHIRRYLLDKFKSKCSKCGWQEANPFSGRIPVEIDHIDGNWKNNKEENLTVLCPNCHSLTSTFRFMNKGKGRIRNPA